MKRIIVFLAAAGISSAASAQPYPSPTYNALTLLNPLSVASGGTGTTTSTGTGSVVRSNGPTLTNLLMAGGSGTLTGPLVINPNPASEAPAYTTGNTAEFMVGDSVHGLPELWTIFDGGGNHDGVVGMLRSIPATTITQIDGTSGYCDNANPNNMTSGVGVCVAVGAFAVNRVDGAMSWWVDSIVSDTGTGGSVGRLLQGEVDFKPEFSNTQVAGLIFAMDSPIVPSNADGFLIGSTYNGTTRLGRWANGFRCYDGSIYGSCALMGLAGLSSPTAPPSTQSQVLGFVFTTASAVETEAELSATPSYLILARSDGVPYDFATTGMFQAGSGLKIGGQTVLPRSIASAVVAAGTSQSTATVLTSTVNYVGSGTGGVQLQPFSAVTLPTIVFNTTNSAINVYPPIGYEIGFHAVNGPVSLAAQTGMEVTDILPINGSSPGLKVATAVALQ